MSVLGNCLGQVSCVTVLPEKTEATEPTDCQKPALDIIKSTLEKLPKDLTSEQKQQVIDLLTFGTTVFKEDSRTNRTASSLAVFHRTVFV